MSQVEQSETKDEVIQEVRRIKESLAREMDFDLDRILAAARELQKKSDRTIIPVQVRQEA